MHEFDAEVFSAGTWNGDTYTVQDLDSMVRNFEELKGEIKPPLKPGHSGGFGKPGDIAFGWVTRLRRAGEKLIATFSQVPDVVYRAIKAGRFKRVSAEVYWKLRHGDKTYDRVLAAVSVLGARVPAVTNLADLEAYLTRSTDPESGSFEREAAYEFGLGNEDGGDAITINHQGGHTMPTEKEFEDNIKAEKAAREKAEREAGDYKAKYEAEVARQAGERRKTREAEFKAYCEGQVKAGKMTPAARDALTASLDKRAYSDDAGLSFSAEDIKAVFEKQGKVLPEGGKGKGDGQGGDGKTYASAGLEVDARTKKIAAERKLDYSTALKAVLAEDKELAKAYEAESVRTVAEDDEDQE